MSKLYSFKSAKDQVIIDEPYAWFNTESGDVLITDDFHAERVALTRYPDVYHGNAEFIDGFKCEDLIFSENPDVVMRGGSGFELLEQVRAEPGLRDIPFILLTSSCTDEASRANGLELGADRYLIRPIEPEALLAAIRECLTAR